MPKHDIFAIGASGGGVEALQKLVSELPADFPGALFVVIHLPPRTRSFLPEILNKAGKLPACHPQDGERIQNGRIYVAPPDHHLVLEREHLHLGRGPKEQHHRP
jgi:two-component system chemotaxis response regulator CheB